MPGFEFLYNYFLEYFTEVVWIVLCSLSLFLSIQICKSNLNDSTFYLIQFQVRPQRNKFLFKKEKNFSRKEVFLSSFFPKEENWGSRCIQLTWQGEKIRTLAFFLKFCLEAFFSFLLLYYKTQLISNYSSVFFKMLYFFIEKSLNDSFKTSLLMRFKELWFLQLLKPGPSAGFLLEWWVNTVLCVNNFCLIVCQVW